MSDIKPRGNSFTLGLFLHSAVDDSDLTVYEFRVYAHLCRRVGDEMRVWEGQKKIAAACKMSRAAVQTALYGLRDKGWIELRKHFREDGSQTTNDIMMCGPPASVEGTPRLSERHPLPLTEAAKGNPREGNPLKDLKDCAASRTGQDHAPSLPAQTASQGSQKKQATSLETVPPAPVSIPAPLLSHAGFEEAWGEWLAYRRKRRLSCLPVTLQKQINRLSNEADPVGVINWTLEQGYQGLVTPKEFTQQKPRNQQQANDKFMQGVQAKASAVKGVFDD